MYKGSCLCGTIRYVYSGELTEISMCHCRQCRKAQGSAFAAVAPIQSSGFAITKGQAYLKVFRSSSNKVRVFCQECGSPIYSARDNLPEIKRLRIGTLDTPLVVKERFHTFINSKAEWYETADKLPQYAGFKY